MSNVNVQYTGNRVVGMKTIIRKDGQILGRYIFKAGAIHAMTEIEASILIGTTPPVYGSDGITVITGFVVDGLLVNGLIDEIYQIVPTEKTSKPKRSKTIEQSENVAETPQPEVVAPEGDNNGL